jgi:transcriptional regulator with XRE-family HTH domain
MTVRTSLASSTLRRGGISLASSTDKGAEISLASSTDERVRDVDARRRRLGLSNAGLCRRADVHPTTWLYLRRGEQRPSKETLTRLNAALDRHAHGGEGQARSYGQNLYRLVVTYLARFSGFDVATAQAAAFDFKTQKPQDPEWLALARLRQLAIYVVSVEMQVGNAELARAIGCTRQNVFKARNVVEDRRDLDPRLHEAIATISGAWSGV